MEVSACCMESVYSLHRLSIQTVKALPHAGKNSSEQTSECKMQMQNANAKCECKMRMQNANAKCECKMRMHSMKA